MKILQLEIVMVLPMREDGNCRNMINCTSSPNGFGFSQNSDNTITTCSNGTSSGTSRVSTTSVTPITGDGIWRHIVFQRRVVMGDL